MESEMIAKLLVRASRDDQRLNVLGFCLFASLAVIAWILK